MTKRFDDLKLYMLPGCPFCAKVQRFMDANDIEIEELNSADPKNAEELIRVGGKKQSPCLFIDGNAMYESDDIIDYLQERIGA